MAELGRLTIDLVANIGGFERDMGKASRATRREMGKVRRELRQAERDAEMAAQSFKRLGLQISAIAAIGLGVTIREFQKLASVADGLDKTAGVVGVTVEALQELRFAAQQAAGVTGDTLDMALQRFSRRVGEAANGTGELLPIVEQLGISLRDSSGNIRSQTDLLGEFADAIAGTANEQEQLRIAFKLFDSEGARLVNLLREGSDGIEQFREQFRQTGATITGEVVSDFVRFNDELNVLRQQASAVGVSIASDLIGPLADFAEFLNTAQGQRELQKVLEGLKDTAEILAVIFGVRLAGGLAVAAGQFALATVRAAQANVAMLTLQGSARGAAIATTALGTAVRLALGPVGAIVTILGTLAFQLRDVDTNARAAARGLNDAARAQREFTRASSNDPLAGLNLEEATQELEKQERVYRRLSRQLDETNPILADQKALIDQLRALVANLTEEQEKQIPALEDTERATQRVAVATYEYEEALYSLQRQLAGPFDQAQMDAMQAAQEFIALFVSGKSTFSELAAALDLVNQSLRRQRSEIVSNDPAIRSMIAQALELSNVMGLLASNVDETASGLNSFGQAGQQIGQNFAQSILNGQDIQDSLSNALTGYGGAGLAESLGNLFGEALENGFENLGDSDAFKASAEGYALALGQAIEGNIGQAALTAIGSAIGGPIGALIGSLIGDAIFGDGTPKFQITGSQRQFDLGIDLTLEGPLGQLNFAFREIESEAQIAVRNAFIEFDTAIAGFIRNTDQLTQIDQALQQFGVSSRSNGESLEGLLELRFDAILSTFDATTRAVVEAAGLTLESQVQALADVQSIAIEEAFRRGLGIENVLQLVSELQIPGEQLAVTFSRLVSVTNLLDQASSLVGRQLDESREGVIRFGNELLDVFGDDLTQVQNNLQRIFDTFFTDSEINQQTADAARARASELLSQIGVEATAGLFTESGFRELFDSLFGTLSPEDTAILIEAGAAIADLIDAEQALADAREETNNSAIEQLANIRAGLEEQLALLPLSDFNQEMVAIQRQLNATIAAINEAAAAAGDQEQAEQALADAHQLAAIQAAQAIARLEESARDLAEEIFGSALSRVRDQISELQSATEVVETGLSNVTDQLRQLADFANSLLIGNLSPLNSFDRLNEALRQLRQAAAAGDASAVQSLAQTVLQIGRDRFASGQGFVDLFNEVQRIIRGTRPSEQDVQPVSIVASPALEELFAEERRLVAEEEERQRRLLGFDLAQQIADFAQATGLSFDEAANRIGFDISELGDLLGFTPEEFAEYLKSLQVDTATLATTIDDAASRIVQAIQDSAARQAELSKPIALEQTKPVGVDQSKPIDLDQIGRASENSPPVTSDDVEESGNRITDAVNETGLQTVNRLESINLTNTQANTLLERLIRAIEDQAQRGATRSTRTGVAA